MFLFSSPCSDKMTNNVFLIKQHSVLPTLILQVWWWRSRSAAHPVDERKRIETAVAWNCKHNMERKCQSCSFLKIDLMIFWRPENDRVWWKEKIHGVFVSLYADMYIPMTPIKEGTLLSEWRLVWSKTLNIKHEVTCWQQSDAVGPESRRVLGIRNTGSLSPEHSLGLSTEIQPHLDLLPRRESEGGGKVDF